MFLSVIIPTRNRARHLMRALSSLNEQTCEAESFEILVVDNGSTDNTREVCEAYRSLFPNFQYLYDSRPGLHAGRHLGMKRAKADILVYADDDISAFPTWLESIAYGFQDPRVALVGGKNLPLFELDPPRWLTDMWEKPRTDGRILGYLSIMDLGDQIKEITPFLVFGCNFSVRKNVIYEAGGFHPDAMPEELIRYRGDGETHISQYIFEHGYLTLYHPKASVFHLIPPERMTEDYFCHRAFLQGISDSYTCMRIGRSRLWTHLRELNIVGRRLLSRKPMSTFISEYSRGFWYHQKEARKDPDLYNWIMKSTYLS